MVARAGLVPSHGQHPEQTVWVPVTGTGLTRLPVTGCAHTAGGCWWKALSLIAGWEGEGRRRLCGG